MLNRTVVKIEPAPTEERWALSRSQERERQQAVLLLPHEELVAKLWQRVMIPDSLCAAALDMSDAHYQSLKANGDAPPRIVIGSLRYVLVADLRAWLEARPRTTETKQRRRQTRKPSDESASTAAPVLPEFPALHAAKSNRVR